MLGGGRRAWIRRIIDVSALAARAGVVGSDGATELATAAARCRVPHEETLDCPEAALVTAQLFIILASKVRPSALSEVGGLLKRS